MTARKVAFIGLGAIGLPMARRLGTDSSVDMSIYDIRTDVLERESHLGRPATSIADCIADAEVIFSVLPADTHVRGVAQEVAETATSGQIYVDFSTIEPTTIIEVEKELGAAGVHVLGAALTRSVAAAETGELSIFIGGPESVCANIRPLLDRLATDVRVLPTPAHAKVLKVMNNMIVGTTSVMLCDALVLGAAHDVDPRELTSRLIAESANSWALQNQIIKHVLTGELAPGRFSTRYMGKDATLATAVARRHGQPAFFAGVVRAAFRGTTALGLGDHYHPSVVRWFEHSALRPQIRVWGPATEAAGTQEAATVIVESIAVQQALLTLNALALLRLEGVDPSTALPHLKSGSSQNDLIDDLLSKENGIAAVTLAQAAERILRALDLADQASVPAWGFEVSSHVAAAQIALHGPDATFREIVAELNDIAT